MKNPPVLELACCCGHVYGDHVHRAPHRCREHLCTCTEFRAPVSRLVVIDAPTRNAFTQASDRRASHVERRERVPPARPQW